MQPSQQPKPGLPGWAKALIILVIVGFVFVALAGIGVYMLGNYLASGGAEKLIEKGIERAIEEGAKDSGENLPKDLKVDVGNQGFVVKDEATGEEFSVKAGNQIPENFPKDIPIFSPSTVVSTMIMGGMEMVTLETSASLDEASAFYKSKLPEAGWQNPFSGAFAQGTYSALYQKEDRQLTVSISNESGKTMIVLSNAKTPSGM